MLRPYFFSATRQGLFSALALLALTLPAGPSLLAQKKDTGQEWKHFFAQGEKLRENRQYQKAIKEYELALAIADTSSQARLGIGICQFMLNDLDEAIGTFNHIIAQNPAYTPAYQALVKGYSRKRDGTAIIAAMEKLIESERNPQKRLGYKLNLIERLIEAKDYRHAHKFSLRAVKLDPKNLDALFYDAHVNNQLGHYHAALKSVQQALPLLDKKTPEEKARFYYEIGYAHFKLENFSKSKLFFLRAAHGKYKNIATRFSPEHFYRLGSAYAQVYDYKTARGYLENAVKIDPGFARAYILLADIDIKVEHHNKAIQHYRQAVKGKVKEEMRIKLYTFYIDVLLNSGRPAEAVQEANRILAEYPHNREILYMKAVGLLKVHKAKGAATLLAILLAEPSLSLFEKVKFNFVHGLALEKSELYGEARKAFEKARKGAYSPAAQDKLEGL